MSSDSTVTRLKHVVGNVLRAAPGFSRPFRGTRRRRLYPDMSFRVGLERPVAYETVGEEFEIRGWAVSLDSLEVSGTIVINDCKRFPVDFSELRIDVARAFDLRGGEAVVGFRHYVRWDEIDEQITHAHVRLEFSHGEDTLVLGPVTVYRAWPIAAQRFAFRLERPANNEVVSQDVEIRGWVASLDGQPVLGRVLIGDDLRVPLVFDQVRPDVDQLYELTADSPPAGFDHRFPWSDLGEGVTQTTVNLEIVHGQDLILLGPYTVTKTSASILRHQRGSYHEVWDGAASDPVSAMASVAGTSDQEEFMNSGISTARTIKEGLQITAEDVVLEIGCGVGRVGHFLAPHCQTWIGSDISANMLNFARKNLAHLDNVELVTLSSSSLAEFADQSVDKVYCSTVFMHLDEWDRYRYVAEAFRVLRPGGRCYFDNVNLGGEIGWAVFEEVLSIDPAQRSAAVSKASTGEELMTYLRMAGFSGLQLRPEPLYISIIGTKP